MAGVNWATQGRTFDRRAVGTGPATTRLGEDTLSPCTSSLLKSRGLVRASNIAFSNSTCMQSVCGGGGRAHPKSEKNTAIGSFSRVLNALGSSERGSVARNTVVDVGEVPGYVLGWVRFSSSEGEGGSPLWPKWEDCGENGVQYMQKPQATRQLEMDKHGRPLLALLPLLLCLSLLRASPAASVTAGNPDGTELWGFVEVRPTSGVGIGNFMEVGPLDVNLKPRNSTWLQKADLIFVDNPVGVGYSYVEDDSLLVTTDWQAATDATTLLKALAKELPTLQQGSPLFLVAESYGGKYAATLGLSVARAVRAGDLKIKLAGVALGDSWVSPEDFTLAYAPLLLEVSRLDDNAGDAAKKKAATVKEQIAAGRLADSQGSWSELLDFIDSKSASVDMYNFLLDAGMDPVAADLPATSSTPTTSSSAQVMKYSTYLGGSQEEAGSNTTNTLGGIMNGVVKEKLKIIPKDHEWDGLKNFLSLPRQPLSCGSSKVTKAFVRSYKNLHFYWILGAGHFDTKKLLRLCGGGCGGESGVVTVRSIGREAVDPDGGMVQQWQWWPDPAGFGGTAAA
ncbi:unnamed protein product [Triticum turgidum subsp. durum]|uniref:Carboxypeptidase n=1 Tax=Triticum turgidum subsp. durum TaxID=4567 RepID=A0A9R0Q6V5_TRITD|nr:unnamed protein product [Triticum turgidum subsp. durum]